METKGGKKIMTLCESSLIGEVSVNAGLQQEVVVACNRIVDENDEASMVSLVGLLQESGNLDLVIRQHEEYLQRVRDGRVQSYSERVRHIVEIVEFIAQNPRYLDLI